MNRIIALAGLLFVGGCAAAPPLQPAATTVQEPAPRPQQVAMIASPATAPADSNLFGINVSGGLLGKKCRVQFRRDALGLAAPGLLEPTATSSGGKSTAIVGTVDQISDVWLVLRVNKELYWVPVQQILMVEVVE